MHTKAEEIMKYCHMLEKNAGSISGFAHKGEVKQ